MFIPFIKNARPKVDIVVGIASGASLPAKIIADILQLPLRYLHINYRDTDNTPKFDKPHLINTDDIPSHFKRILLVDDVSVSGKTLDCALENLSNYIVFTLVLKGRADYVLFPEIKTCVNWPWNSESD